MRTTSCGRVATGTARVLLGVLFGLVVVTAAAPPAAAHTALKSSSPQAGARVNTPPSEITLVFTGPIRGGLSRVIVQGPGDARFESGPPQVSGDTVVQPLRALGAPGRYEIAYRIVAADGHPLAGTVRFTLTQDATATSTSSAAPAPGPTADPGSEVPAGATGDVDDGGTSPWLIAGGAVAGLAFVSGAVWFGRRATRDLD